MKKMILVLFVVTTAFTLNAKAQNCHPWVKQWYKAWQNREPTAWECNIQLYGNFQTYNDLATKVLQYHDNLNKAGLSVQVVPFKNNQAIAIFNQNGRKVAANIITQDGGSIVASGGGNIIAQGGGNIIGNDGASLKGVTFGPSSTRVSMAGGQVIKISDNNALIIK